MSLLHDLRQKLLWAKTDEITLSRDELEGVLTVIEAAVEFCGAHAADLEDSEDDTLVALIDTLRSAGEEFGD